MTRDISLRTVVSARTQCSPFSCAFTQSRPLRSWSPDTPRPPDRRLPTFCGGYEVGGVLGLRTEQETSWLMEVSPLGMDASTGSVPAWCVWLWLPAGCRLQVGVPIRASVCVSWSAPLPPPVWPVHCSPCGLCGVVHGGHRVWVGTAEGVDYVTTDRGTEVENPSEAVPWEDRLLAACRSSVLAVVLEAVRNVGINSPVCGIR